MNRIFTILSLLFLSGLTYAQGQAPEMAARQYLQEHRQELGLTSADIADYRITDLYTSKRNQITYLYINQTYQNVELFGSTANAVFDQSGRLVKMNVRFTQNLAGSITGKTATLSPEEALRRAADHLQLSLPANFRAEEVVKGPDFNTTFRTTGWALEDVEVRQMYFNADEDGIRLAWEVDWYETSAEHRWFLVVDAGTGEILYQKDQVIHCSFGPAEHTHSAACTEHTHAEKASDRTAIASFLAPDSYLIFPIPLESPNHGPQSVVTNPADPVASPFAWHDTDGVAGAEYTITRGNNVHAYQDGNNTNSSNGDEPDGGPALEFDYPYDFNAGPSGYVDAAVVNLFAWNNLMHDVWYQYGFDEQAGNFQENNYGNGGLEGDYIRAEAQDGSGLNNANFSSGEDGSSARIQMYLWTDGSGGDIFTVDAPADIAGGYTAEPATFGPFLPTTPLAGTLVLADDGTATPTLGCQPLVNGAEIDGNIALIDRGDCTFVEKVNNAQEAGAIAVVVCNNTGGDPINMGGADPDITIPSIMIRQDDCTLIKSYLTDGVEVTLVDNTTYYDGDFDNGIIAHEYGHGLSIRMTGGPSTGSCLSNSEQMGEGWSDYVGLMMTIEPGDTGEDIRGIGTFALNEPTDGNGIRPAPYSTDFAINDYTYGASNNLNISQPHGVGFVWCTALWEMTWDLIDEYGFDPDFYYGTGGNNIAMHLVTEGMKLQPCLPGFVDGRDAILLADELFYSGANRCLIWEAFARRGLGFSADQGSSDSRTDQVEAFDMPPFCEEAVAPPTAGFSVSSTVNCSGFFTFVDESTDTPQQWLWDFGNGDSSTAFSPNYTYDQEGTYLVTLIVTNTLGADTTSLEVTVDFPDAPITEDEVTACSGESAILEASGSGTINWYLANVLIATGTTYQTPNLTNNIIFEVETEVSQPDLPVGPMDNSFGSGGYFDNDVFRGLFFSTYKPLVIESAWVDAPTAGERTFEVQDLSGNVIYSEDIFIAAGQDEIDLNIEIENPGNYIIGASNANLFRNDAGADYPYELSGLLSITGSNATTSDGYYYFLYDWQVREASCFSERIPVVVNVVPKPDANFDIVQNDETISLMDNSIDAVTYSWDFGDGNVSDEQNPTHTYTENGTFTVTLTVSNAGCTDTFTQTVEVSTLSSVARVEGLLAADLFPNPGTGRFLLDVQLNQAADVQVQVFNTQGQELLLREFDRTANLQEPFDLDNFPAGVYLVRIGWGGSAITKRYVLIR